LTHKVHQPSGLIWPSTSLQVFEAAMKFKQLLHFCASFGFVWYCTLAFGTFLVAAGAAEFALLAGELKSAIGTKRLQPTANAPRSTALRGGISSFIMHSPWVMPFRHVCPQARRMIRRDLCGVYIGRRSAMALPR